MFDCFHFVVINNNCHCHVIPLLTAADNKSSPHVQCYREPVRNVKPDCLVTIDDDDMLKAMLGKVNPQRVSRILNFLTFH